MQLAEFRYRVNNNILEEEGRPKEPERKAYGQAADDISTSCGWEIQRYFTYLRENPHFVAQRLRGEAMTTYYVAQEQAMAPGISGDWPDTITTGDQIPPHGRLAKMTNPLPENTAEAWNYAIALQRAIEYHCSGKEIPEKIANQCPHHSHMLNHQLLQQGKNPAHM